MNLHQQIQHIMKSFHITTRVITLITVIVVADSHMIEKGITIRGMQLASWP
jgi:hypothetical protein